MTPSPVQISVPESFVPVFVFYILSYLLLKKLGYIYGCPLPAFRSCFAEVAKDLNDLLMNLTSLVAQTVKRLSAMWETQVRSLGWEKSPGEGNGNPLLDYCLENPTDRGAW